MTRFFKSDNIDAEGCSAGVESLQNGCLARGLGFKKLHCIQMVVELFIFHQLFVIACFDYPAFFEDDNLIGIVDGA